ncbi:CPBP family intramembrane glutamic endopeptidase [Bacillus massiliigorillae]|uniref:CPBP family intramembrane glutamic endopeptidase n=1 Tax=Bacillus massiliigorillae TaxID=1243664 RepID=UPI0003A4A33A|nr:type II CAAX endopeptidase family protein [Bacillus massiliigorillae]
MKSCAKDGRLILGLISAHILIYITYHNTTAVFWYLYTASILFCVSIAITSEKNKDIQSSIKESILYGVLSGVLIYAIFALGNTIIQWLDISSLTKDISRLYKHYSPSLIWHFIVLFLVIIPGEEIFWRGFVQKRINEYFQGKSTIIIATVLYALPMIYSQNIALILAGLTAGFIWAVLYQWKRSLSLVIISHLIFDFLLLVIFPFR